MPTNPIHPIPAVFDDEMGGNEVFALLVTDDRHRRIFGPYGSRNRAIMAKDEIDEVSPDTVEVTLFEMSILPESWILPDGIPYSITPD